MVASLAVSTPKPAALVPQPKPAPVPRPASRPVTQFISPPPGREFYFGFGANMAPRVVLKRKLYPTSATPATLNNHKLYFNHIGGYGSIEYRPEDSTRPDVHGVVLDLSEDEMKVLADIETGYNVREVIVTGDEGQRYVAKAFVSNWSVRLFQETVPTEDYIGKLREGAQFHKLPEEYQAWLQSIEGRENMMDTSGDHDSAFASPASFLAAGFSAALFIGACALLVGPPRR